MGEELLFTLFGVLGIGSAIWAILRYFKRRDQISAVWRVAAERLGGQFQETHARLLSAGGISITARVDDATVTVDHYTTGSSNTQVTYTRIRTQAPGSGSLHLRLSREGILASMSKALGGQDITVGTPTFDERYRIKGSDEAMARAWLDEASQAAITEAEPYDITLESGELRAERVGLEDSVRKLVETVRAVSSVAGGGRRLLDRWKVLSEALGGKVVAKEEVFEVDGGTMTLVERAGAQVLVDVLQEQVSRLGGSTRLWTRLRARHPAPSGEERFAIVDAAGLKLLDDPKALVELSSPEGDDDVYRVLSTEPTWGEATLTAPLWRRVLALSPSAITGDREEVTVILAGLVLDERRMIAALELATELTGASTPGPYR